VSETLTFDIVIVGSGIAGLRAAIEAARASDGKSSIAVEDQAKEYNSNLINVLELESMFEISEIILLGGLNRTESRGAHSRTDYPNRDDEHWLKHTLAYYTGVEPRLDYAPVTIINYQPTERHY
jgi:succinate dehydrogenase / fumarate reductase flavoprotein subunit